MAGVGLQYIFSEGNMRAALKYCKKIRGQIGAPESKKLVRSAPSQLELEEVLDTALAGYLWKEWGDSFSGNIGRSGGEIERIEVENKAKALRDAGFEWCAVIRLWDFMDRIPHDRLVDKIDRKKLKPEVRELLKTIICCPALEDQELVFQETGLMRNRAVSRILGELYLSDTDHYMGEGGLTFIRMDDCIYIYRRSYEEAEQAMRDICSWLESEERLLLDQQGTGIFPEAQCRPAQKVVMNDAAETNAATDAVTAPEEFRDRKRHFRNWHTTEIQKPDRNYHLISDGILRRRDYNILFENLDRKKYIPIETMDSLYVHSHVTLSSSFFELADKHGLNVTFCNKYGRKIGTFVPYSVHNDAKMLITQVMIYENVKERLRIARRLEVAAFSNMRANVRYYARRLDCEELREIAQTLTGCIHQAGGCRDLTQLLMIEARARQNYYQSFRFIIREPGVTFEKRSRRPPADAINALISFGNTLLYQRMANEINHTSLDIRFGFLHAAGRRAESLNLDLAELFKPILVDRTIFTLINRRILRADTDFYRTAESGIYLGRQGKEAFLEEFERKVYSVVKASGIRRSYASLLREEAHKISRYVACGEEYHPYKYAE